jgi:hypothetical protein
MIAESLAEPTHNRKQSFYARHQTTIILASCMLLGLMLRIALAGRSGLWRDEAQFLWIVRIPSLPAMLDFLWHHESHPPLFYVLMRAWLSLFSDSEAAALALPVLLGVILIPIVYRVGDRVFSHYTGLIAAILVTVSPLLARYSGMVRPYSLLPLLCLLSVYWLWDGLRGRGARPWVAHAIATLAMLVTHNWAWMVLAAEWIIVAGWFALRREPLEWTLVRSWAIAQLALLVVYSPWLPILLYQSRHAGYDAFPLNPFVAFAYFAETVISLPVQAAVPVCMVLIVTAAWRVAVRRATVVPKDGSRQLSLLIFVGIPLLAFGVATLLSIKKFLLFPQCLTSIVPCVLLSIAYGIASLSNMPRVVTLVFTSIYIVFLVKDLGEIKSNAREVASVVAAQARPADLILITPVWYASPFNYYYTLDNPQSNYPHEERRGAIDYDDLRARLLDPEPMARVRARLAQAHGEGRRIWLVTAPYNLSDGYHARRVLSDKALGSDRLPDTLLLPTYGHVARVRAIQLQKQLDTLYGTPKTIVVSPDGREGPEMLDVLLYAEDDPTLQTTVEPGRSRSGRPGG